MGFIKLSRSFFSIQLIIFPYLAFAIDVIGIGAMQTEITSFVSDAQFKKDFATVYRVNKGQLNFINYNEADNILEKLSNKIVSPGGEVSGVLLHIAALGGKATFSTKLANDTYAENISRLCAEKKVEIITGLKQLAQTTSLLINIITPDGVKTKLLLLGSSASINQRHLRYDIIKEADYLLIEANLWDGRGPKAKALKRAINAAKRSQKSVVFLLTDKYYTAKYNHDFISMLPEFDIVIGNVGEYCGLFQEEDTNELEKRFDEYPNTTFVMTRGSSGAKIANNNRMVNVENKQIAKDKVDSTGAGVAFAAGFIYEYNKNRHPGVAGEFASKLAYAVIKQAGASNIDVKDEVE